jgi:hypothetical protein
VIVRRFDGRGEPLGEPVVLAGGVGGSANHAVASVIGDRAHVAWAECEDEEIFNGERDAWERDPGTCLRHRLVVRTYDFRLRPLGALVEVHRTERFAGVDLGRFAATEGRVALSWVDIEHARLGAGRPHRNRVWLAVLDGERVLARHEHVITTESGGAGYRFGHGSTTVSAGAGVFLACESVRFVELTCQRYDREGGLLGARFSASSFDTTHALDTAWSGCDFLLVHVGSMAEPPSMWQRYAARVERLDARTGAREHLSTLESDFGVERSDERGAFREVLDINIAFLLRRQWLEGASLPMLITPVSRVYSEPRRVLRREILQSLSCR